MPNGGAGRGLRKSGISVRTNVLAFLARLFGWKGL